MQITWEQSDEHYFASDVAEIFLASMEEEDPSEIERVEGIVFMAGQHLADLGTAGLWARFEAASFFAKTHGSRHFQVGVALTLISVFTVLGYNQWISPECARRIVNEIRTVAPKSDILTQLARSSDEALCLEAVG